MVIYKIQNLIVQVKHVLATVDATVESELAQKYQVFHWISQLFGSLKVWSSPGARVSHIEAVFQRAGGWGLQRRANSKRYSGLHHWEGQSHQERAVIFKCIVELRQINQVELWVLTCILVIGHQSPVCQILAPDDGEKSQAQEKLPFVFCIFEWKLKLCVLVTCIISNPFLYFDTSNDLWSNQIVIIK